MIWPRPGDSSLPGDGPWRIVQIVESEQSRKGATQRLTDRIAGPLVPGILVAGLLIAVVGAIFGDAAFWIERALVVVVAASPCALAISVPVTVVASIGAASKHGVLVKGGAAMETLGKVRTIALDKTGTLTRNEPVVIDVAATAGHTSQDVLSAYDLMCRGGYDLMCRSVPAS